MSRLRSYYDDVISTDLMKEFGYKNKMHVPRLSKVVLSMGVGDALNDKNILPSAVNDLTLIAGQKAIVTKARRSVAAFKLRLGADIGCKVTLRRSRMYEFIDRLINIALPRARDFRGLSPSSFDGNGNYSLGVREQIIFPEINYDKVERIRGFNVSIITTAGSDEEGRALLKGFLFPFFV